VNPRLVGAFLLPAVVDRQDLAPDRLDPRLVARSLCRDDGQQTANDEQESGQDAAQLNGSQVQTRARVHDLSNKAGQSRPTDVRNATGGRLDRLAQRDE